MHVPLPAGGQQFVEDDGSTGVAAGEGAQTPQALRAGIPVAVHFLFFRFLAPQIRTGAEGTGQGEQGPAHLV